MSFLYLTRNGGKIREAQRILRDQHGLAFETLLPGFGLPEIQSDSCAEVAAFKASFAANRLEQACLCSDAGLYLSCLGGLPGPYNAQFEQQIGTEKFLALLQHQTDRRARLEYVFAYCEPGQEPVVFTGGSTGTVAWNARGSLGRWHEFFYIPDGETRTLSEIREQDPLLEDTYWGTALQDFARWYKAGPHRAPVDRSSPDGRG